MNNPAASSGVSDPRTASGGRVRRNVKLGRGRSPLRGSE